MASESNNRRTQLDFKTLRGIWDPESILQSATAHNQKTTSKALPKARRIGGTESAAPEVNCKSSNPAKILQRRATTAVTVRQYCPWDYYERMYQLRLGLDHRIIVAEERHPPAEELANVYSIRRFSDADMTSRQHLFRDIRHTNLVAATEIFWHERICYVVFEHMPCSLHEVRDIEHLTELRLAAIVGQVSLILFAIFDPTNSRRFSMHSLT
jgi:hypothetical protein